MRLIYNILYFIFSPILLAIPIFAFFVGVPILILGLPGLLWRGCKRMLFPTTTTTPTPAIQAAPPTYNKPYKPRPKRSKMAGIRRNRAILDIARGGIMRSQIKRLRLKEGDLVVVRDQDTADALITAAKGMKGVPNCPIVVTRDSIHRLSADYIRRLLAKKDAASSSTSAIAG